MLFHSLRTRLIALWALALLACTGVGGLLVHIAHESTAAQVARAQAVVARSCDLIGERWRFFSSNWAGLTAGRFDDRLRKELVDVATVALARQQGVEGGIWQAGAGPLAYAFPTYEGAGPKTDLPAAELKRIEAINRQASQDEQSVSRSFSAATETLLLQACPLRGPVPGLTAWAMTRVHATSGLGPLRLGLLLLFGLLVAMALWLGRTLMVWTRHINGIRAALAGAGAQAIPRLAPTGERELDAIIASLNDASGRLAEARRAADEAGQRAARAERLASLGRVAAGLAHEIRNPIAAALLQGENALAGGDARRREAIGEILGELGRLDRLVTDLLAMTQRTPVRPSMVRLNDVIEEPVARLAQAAAVRNVHVAAFASGSAELDTSVVGRILDNLLSNAIRHAPRGGQVEIRAERTESGVLLTVADNGAGVAPDLTGRLFEPFVTGRPDGTGLGLAIARELAEAHGGSLELGAARGEAEGAVFTLSLPQPEFAEPLPCQQSSSSTTTAPSGAP